MTDMMINIDTKKLTSLCEAALIGIKNHDEQIERRDKEKKREFIEKYVEDEGRKWFGLFFNPIKARKDAERDFFLQGLYSCGHKYGQRNRIDDVLKALQYVKDKETVSVSADMICFLYFFASEG